METVTYLQAIIMGLVQGLAEFLPVSSSGHLVLSKFILGAELGTSALFEILLHVGTLLPGLIRQKAGRLLSLYDKTRLFSTPKA